ncbi:MAG: PspC domain-containing protein [Eubacteriales bacterium]
MNDKKLTKSTNKMICGVCAGIGEYFNCDATIVRLLFVIFGFWGPALLTYIIAAIIMPDAY